jgi:hypothetical protein
MSHKKYKEMLVLQLYNELKKEEQNELEKHLKECDECRNEKENLRKFRRAIPQTASFAEDEDLIVDSRKSLRYALRAERKRKSVRESISEFWRYSFPTPYKMAFGGVATMAIGIFIGYLAFADKTNSNVLDSGFITAGSKIAIEGSPQISGLKFINTNQTEGEVEFTYEQSFPMHVKGNINEPRIQKLLASAMVNDENPGVRLKTVNMIADNQKGKPDDDMKKSLINALKYDNNPGVRKEAMRVLRKLPFDNEIKDAFLFVLMNDKSSGMRIAAINNLGEAKDFEKFADMKMLNVLRERELKDDNDYIRIRAKTLLQEVKQ